MTFDQERQMTELKKAAKEHVQYCDPVCGGRCFRDGAAWALEQAARIADEHFARWRVDYTNNPSVFVDGQMDAAKELAAAIREGV